MKNSSYLDDIRAFREARNIRLASSPNSWLALIGLFRLAEGDNPFGANPINRIIIPGLIQEECGSFRLEKGKITLVPNPIAGLTINGTLAVSGVLHTDHTEVPDRIEIGSMSMMILQRGSQYYLRVWDKDAAAIRSFKGLNYFPINPKYRIKARFHAYNPSRQIKVLDVIGTESEGYLSGEALFLINGVECKLVAEEDGDDLLFSFTDKTREDLTYPGGRFLLTAKQKKGVVILDFNRAINWPCAYTDFATCPLPPPENNLPVRIEAGEMKYKKQHDGN